MSVYRGKEKYIFVSYAHKDSEKVLPVIENLQRVGFRMWYDTGIEAGTEWPAYIQESLEESEVVLAFVSSNAVESFYCRSEITFALSHHKEVLVVYLEKTELKYGLGLQLTSLQSLFRFRHSSERSFLEELMKAKILQECKYNEILFAESNQQKEKNITKKTMRKILIRTFKNLVATRSERDYRKAVALMNEGKYVEALSTFESLHDYKDSRMKSNRIKIFIKKKKIFEQCKIGNAIQFGAYQQTDDFKKNIEWMVLDVKDSKVLLISKYALDCKPYHTTLENITWENCTLRLWLNNEFLNTAFSESEKTMISTTTIPADKDPLYCVNLSNETQDKIFLLSIAEAKAYFMNDSARTCKPTDFAFKNRVYVNRETGNCWWWLRSRFPDKYNHNAARISSGGGIIEYGRPVNYERTAVRPALWLDLKAFL